MILLPLLFNLGVLAEPGALHRSFEVGGQKYAASLSTTTETVELSILREISPATKGFVAKIGGYQSLYAGPEARELRVFSTTRNHQAVVCAEWYFESWCQTRIFLVEPKSVTCLFSTSHRDVRSWTFEHNRLGRLKSISFRDRWAAQPQHPAKGKSQMDRYVLTTTLRPDPKGKWKAGTTGSWMPFKDLL